MLQNTTTPRITLKDKCVLLAVIITRDGEMCNQFKHQDVAANAIDTTISQHASFLTNTTAAKGVILQLDFLACYTQM